MLSYNGLKIHAGIMDAPKHEQHSVVRFILQLKGFLKMKLVDVWLPCASNIAFHWLLWSVIDALIIKTQIDELIWQKWRISIDELTQQVKISNGSVYSIICDHLGYLFLCLQEEQIHVRWWHEEGSSRYFEAETQGVLWEGNHKTC